MIPLRIEIDGLVLDSYDAYGLIFLEADKRFSAPIKPFSSTSYVDEPGENIDPRTVPDAFDYVVKVLIHKRGVPVTAVAKRFNEAIKTTVDGIDEYKRITLYCPYKRAKVVGYPNPISESSSYFSTEDGAIVDCAEAELKIRVSDPTLCDFDWSETE